MDLQRTTISEQTGLYINAISSLESAMDNLNNAIQNHYGEEQANDIYTERIYDKYSSLRKEICLLMGDSVIDNLSDLTSNEI